MQHPTPLDIPEIVDPVMRSLPREIADLGWQVRQARWDSGYWKSERDRCYAVAYLAAADPAVKPDGWKTPPEHICKQKAEIDPAYRTAALTYEAAEAQRAYIAGLYEAQLTRSTMVNGLAATERRGMAAG